MQPVPSATSRWRRIGSSLMICLALLSMFACDLTGRAAAEVNGEKIPYSLLEKQMISAGGVRRNDESSKGSEEKKRQAEAQRGALPDLIRELVIRQQARQLGIKVDEDAVSAGVEARVAQYPSRRTYLNHLQESGLDLEFVRDRIEADLMMEKLRSKVGEKAEISEEEVMASYESARGQFESLIHIAHIQVCATFDPVKGCPNITGQDRATAKEIAARARAGEDFGKLAKRYSVDGQTKFIGGSLGWQDPIGPGLAQFPQMAEAARLPEGGISDPLESPAGLHIFKVLARGKTFQLAREELRESLGRPRIDELFAQWLTDHIRRSKIEVDPDLGTFDAESFTIEPPAGSAHPMTVSSGSHR